MTVVDINRRFARSERKTRMNVRTQDCEHDHTKGDECSKCGMSRALAFAIVRRDQLNESLRNLLPQHIHDYAVILGALRDRALLASVLWEDAGSENISEEQAYLLEQIDDFGF